MSKVSATNNFVFLVRDEVEKEVGGLLIPGQGQEKPHKGVIFSCGSLVRDIKIRNGNGKKALFHKGNGQEIEYDGQTYVVLEDVQIIAVV